MAAVASISLLNCCRMSFILFIICLRMAPCDLMDLKFSSSSKAASALRSFLQGELKEVRFRFQGEGWGESACTLDRTAQAQMHVIGLQRGIVALCTPEGGVDELPGGLLDLVTAAQEGLLGSLPLGSCCLFKHIEVH